jgi:hypothetical protein
MPKITNTSAGASCPSAEVAALRRCGDTAVVIGVQSVGGTGILRRGLRFRITPFG